MSLLNDMLRDLETVKVQSKHPVFLTHKRSFRAIYLVTAGGTIASVLGAVLMWCYHPSNNLNQNPLIMSYVASVPVFMSSDRSLTSSDEPMQEALTLTSTQRDDSSGSSLVDSSMSDDEAAPSFLDNDVTDPDVDRALDAVVAVNKPIKQWSQPDVLLPEAWQREQLELAQRAFSEGNPHTAIDCLLTILFKYPTCLEARLQLIQIYLIQSRLSDVHSLINEGLEYSPNNLMLSFYKARVLSQEEHYKEALVYLEPFSPDIREQPDFYGLLASIYQALGRSNEAGSLYQTLLKLDSQNGQYWLGYAIALENKHALLQAIDAYQQASQSGSATRLVRSYAESRLNVLKG